MCCWSREHWPLILEQQVLTALVYLSLAALYSLYTYPSYTPTSGHNGACCSGRCPLSFGLFCTLIHLSVTYAEQRLWCGTDLWFWSVRCQLSQAVSPQLSCTLPLSVHQVCVTGWSQSPAGCTICHPDPHICELLLLIQVNKWAHVESRKVNQQNMWFWDISKSVT